MIKIIFVCHGNICRSPMAEFIMLHLTKEKSCYQISSSATSTEEVGNDMHYLAKKVLSKNNIKYTARHARTFRKTDYQDYDYIIIMDENNYRNIFRIIGSDNSHKIYKLLSFASNSDNKDVSDPYYTGDFDKCFEDIYKGCFGLFEYLEKNNCNK